MPFRAGGRFPCDLRKPVPDDFLRTPAAFLSDLCGLRLLPLLLCGTSFGKRP